MTETQLTSHEAAVSIAPVVLSLREQVFNAIARSSNGMTDDDIQRALNMSGSTERPRRGELLRAGRICQLHFSGQPQFSSTASGRKAVVWVAV